MGAATKSIAAGFGATLILSFIMIIKASMGLMPAMNAIALLTHMAHQMLGTPPAPAIGWILHFLIGSVLWGLAFLALIPVLPGKTPVPKALSFSVLAWLLMMLVLMPLAGQGLFALHIGIPAAIATLVLHLIWGAVLGLIYQWLGAARQVSSHAHRT